MPIVSMISEVIESSYPTSSTPLHPFNLTICCTAVLISSLQQLIPKCRRETLSTPTESCHPIGIQDTKEGRSTCNTGSHEAGDGSCDQSSHCPRSDVTLSGWSHGCWETWEERCESDIKAVDQKPKFSTSENNSGVEVSDQLAICTDFCLFLSTRSRAE